MERESLKSRLGFILISAGCAIGIGNVWKFPYMAGSNGGAIFVLFYFLFLIIMGIPVMTMEFSLGRASKKSPVLMYQQLQKKGQKWHYHGKFAFVGNLLLMMFYTPVAGWMIQYFIKMAKGDFVGLTPAGVAAEYSGMLADPWLQILFTALVVISGFIVCSIGVQKSLEKVTKVMMIALLLIMIVLAVNGFFMDGASEGLKFYLVPNWDKFVAAGPFKVIVGAMTQAFFTLSLGIGSMAIFGSYIGRERSLMGEALNVTILDTFVAIVSGLIIFPACFSFGVQPDAGPPLIFITLPNIFNKMLGGRIWGCLFFVFLFFAAYSTVLAVFENIISMVMDLTNWSRKKTCLVLCVCMLVLVLPAILGFNVLSGVKMLGDGSGFFNLEDFIVSYILLPLGSLCFVLFCTWDFGWGYKNFMEEANYGKGLKVKPWMKNYMKYVLPVIIFAYFIIAMLQFFGAF